jgi:hypothetical protein
MRRKRHEPHPQARVDEPFGPPPIESLYRCSVCGAEMLVHEALSDGGMGMAKCQQEYHKGFMPKGGGAGCKGYTMAYVEQEPSSACRALA